MSLADSIRKLSAFRRRTDDAAPRPQRARRMPIADYDEQATDTITARLPSLSQRELEVVEAYERRHARRAEITQRIVELAADEPWKGYDDSSAEAIAAVLTEHDLPAARRVKVYESTHKNRVEVMRSATQRIALQ